MSGRQAAVGLMALLLIGGCRTRVASRVEEVPRVDLGLEGGNRGYLIGQPPEAGEQKTTRQILHTDIEIPSFYQSKPGGAPVMVGPSVPMEPDAGFAAESEPAPAGPFDTYVVKKGESLWSIAAKPEIYGKATRWQRIFEANRELLKGDPNRLREGMTLNIPRGESGSSDTTYGDDGGTFKK